MKKGLLLTSMMLLCTSLAFSMDPSEEGVATSPLSRYSGGIGVGAMMARNNELQDVSEKFFRLTFMNSVYIRDHVSVFFDIDWFAPGPNVGAYLGADYVFTTTEFRPFLGIGGGANYFDKYDEFGKNIGPTFTAHAGFNLDLFESVQVRARVPYIVTVNEDVDQMVGIEIGFMFSGKYKKIKKLDYNK
ncbi:MAG: hypothetical protein Q4F84_04530 [Fibrobacter sp.]|nr:hypothetical protein [Fibrobacter sp.]